MERKAWFCPSCNKHHAPHVETCPAPFVDPYAFRPFHPKPAPGFDDFRRAVERDPCADCKGPCGNAACPKRLVATSRATEGWGGLTYDQGAWQ